MRYIGLGLLATALLSGIGGAVAMNVNPARSATFVDEMSASTATLTERRLQAPASVEVASDVSGASLTPYPQGSWRLVNPDDLAHVVLWVSHILIRHADVIPRQLSFQISEWAAAPEAPGRSRAEALAQALDIERRLRAGAAKFDEVARDESEDIATRDRGGSLGGVAAIYYRAWPEVLDALAALHEGEVSRVIETEFGFHILFRRTPPPEGRVSGARIIIGHEDTTWFGSFPADRRTVKRSRLEAEALARSIFEAASAHPENFAQLVQQYSEHRDHLRDGDLGEWSTREPTPFAAAIEVLQGLHEGQVAPPMDSLFGYQILLRTPARTRREYAARQLIVPFTPHLPDPHEASRASALRRAEAILREVQADPSRLRSYELQYCCRNVKQWVEGRGRVFLERALDEVQPGEVVERIIESDRAYLVVQRVAPTTEHVESVPRRNVFN